MPSTRGINLNEDGKGRLGPTDPKTYSSTSVRQIDLFLKMFTAFRLDLVTLA